MSPMTVVAFSSGGVTKFGHFAMESLKISLALSLVAASAVVHDVELKSLLVGSSYSMGGVAVVAQG